MGNSGVGKSSIIKRAVMNEYDEKFSPTIGINTDFYNLRLANNALLKLMLEDISG